MDISVIVPLYNEDESLPELEAWIRRVMEANGFSYEIIFVNDGSTDRSWQVITELQKQNHNVKGVCFRRNYGKSPALNVGFERAAGNVVITMDADLQDSPDEIPELYRMITEEGYDLVSGLIRIHPGKDLDLREHLVAGDIVEIERDIPEETCKRPVVECPQGLGLAEQLVILLFGDYTACEGLLYASHREIAALHPEIALGPDRGAETRHGRGYVQAGIKRT